MRYGKRVHKIALDATFTCPNRDGSKGRGGCTFCNNASFSPNGLKPDSISSQVNAGKAVIKKRTGALHYIAYFQAYTNTYGNIDELRSTYDQALSQENIVGLSVGTRPDCVPEPVLELLAKYQQQGYEVWLELGLQSSFDETLNRVNRGHDYQEYCEAVDAAHRYQLNICTHLMLGLPGEDKSHALVTLKRVLSQGVAGLKIHPLHIVKGTRLANEWRRNEYTPLSYNDYIETTCDMIELTPIEVVYHRLTGTAPDKILLAPSWCGKKWNVLNGIMNELRRRGTSQGFYHTPNNLHTV
ncbi:MAG: TIGR01212 family radical SAM protein [marine bacterium B5-7]|nr:MAG: TIGR01212 family radical SAM protein [marine bacterium B5-7]